jgi:porin
VWLLTTAAGVLAQEPAPAPAPAALPAPAPAPVAAPAAAPTAASAPAEPPTPPPPPPYGGPLLERPKLTGDWFGTRDQLRDNGITFDLYSTNFYQGVTSGGLNNNFQFGGRADYLMNVDGQKAGLWQGFFIDLHAETIYGTSANKSTGALTPMSIGQAVPIPSGEITALTGVKFTQALSENFVTFFGKINTLDGFNQPFTGGARGVNGFMNAALVAPLVVLRTVPYSAYGGGFAVLEKMEPVLSVMVLDTNNTPTVSGFNTFFDDGVSIIAQANLPTKFLGLPGHQGIGGTWSNRLDTALDTNLPILLVGLISGEFPPLPQKSSSWSLFYMFDQTLWADPSDPKRSWGLFGNAGIADGNPNPVRWDASVGIGGSSPFKSRKLDSFGVGYYYLGISDNLKAFAPRVLPIRDEQGVELFYNVGVTPWFHFTPDLQVVLPTRERVDASLAFGIRAKIDF